jgi:hypothetical protein
MGTVTLCINFLDGTKESSKVQTKKSTLQFTTSDAILLLKIIIWSTITVSTRNGFPAAPKQLRSSDNHLYSKQNTRDLHYVSVVLLCDNAVNNSPSGFFFF